LNEPMVQEGQRAILQVGSSGRLYVVRVEEIREDAVVVGAPIRLGQVILIKPGTRVDLLFQKAGSMYGFTSTVKRFRGGAIPFVDLEPGGEIHKVQRRDHVRWPVSVPVCVVDPDSRMRVSGYTQDLSGGGLAMVLPVAWEEGKELSLELELPKGLVTARVKVVRSCRKEGAVGDRHVVAVTFADIQPAHREQIIKYVFARQREFLRLGLVAREGR